MFKRGKKEMPLDNPDILDTLPIWVMFASNYGVLGLLFIFSFSNEAIFSELFVKMHLLCRSHWGHTKEEVKKFEEMAQSSAGSVHFLGLVDALSFKYVKSYQFSQPLS